MTKDNEQLAPLPGHFTRRILPWIILAATLAFYCATLNPWLTLGSLGQVARAAGWVWQPTMSEPLTYLARFPFAWLPAHLQPLALNLSAALCAALTLALLARSVALLPQDRTKDQRLREDGDYGLLTIRANFIPPLVAVLVCGLQEQFWKHAISGTGEMFNLLLIAYIIRCLLEYRVSERDSWLVRMAFVYGLATTNNWALIGFLPVTLVTVIMLKKMDFLNGAFFTKMLIAGMAGLALYLLLPILTLRYDHESITFWAALKTNLVAQKQALFYPGFRFPFLILALGSALLPLLLVGIRWPASLGDVNPISNLLVQLLFRVAHAGFFVVGLVLACRPAFIEAQFEHIGLGYLSLIYLGALCLGYFAGYLLLVFGVEPSRAWERPGILLRALNYAVVGLTAATVIVMPVLLIKKNWPTIQASNGPSLANYAAALEKSLPEEEVVLVSDQDWQLWLLQAWQAKQKSPRQHLALHTQALNSRLYHDYLTRRFPNFWRPLEVSNDGKPLPEPINPFILMSRLLKLGENKRIFYLHPSFGYYFEVFQTHPRGLAVELVRANRDDFTFPRLSDEEFQRNQAFWKNLEPNLDLAAQLAVKKFQEGMVTASLFSQGLNQWAVYLQRQGRLPEAAGHFQKALQLVPENHSAQINLAFNQRQQNLPVKTNLVETSNKALALFNSWETILKIYHPFDDPDYLLALSQLFSGNGLSRQAIQCLQRVRQFRPNNIVVEAVLAQTYLQAGKADQVLVMAQSARQNGQPEWQNITNRLEWVRLEALAHFARTNPAIAEAVLQKAIAADPANPLPLAVATDVYLTRGLTTNALAAIGRQLQLEPENQTALLNRGIVLMQLKQYAEAIAPLSKVLEKQPKLLPARMNRAIAFLQANRLEEARRDYEALRQSHPNHFAVYYGLGEIAFRQGQKKVAIEHYESYLEFAPKDTQERRMIEERLTQLKGK